MSHGDSDRAVRLYEAHFGVTDVDYDAPWTGRADGKRCPATNMRSAARIAGWYQMRQVLPREQWSVEACDAIVEAALRTVRDWQEAP